MTGVYGMTVHLEPHNDKWDREYQLCRDEIASILGDNVLEIHHVGSTSIKGILAKPIMDVAVIVKNLGSLKITGMELARYKFYGARDGKGRHLFTKWKDDGVTTHHILCYAKDRCEDCRAALLFRDYLNTHADCAKQYSDLKQELREKYPDDLISYARGKNDFIEKVIASATLITNHYEKRPSISWRVFFALAYIWRIFAKQSLQ